MKTVTTLALLGMWAATGSAQGPADADGDGAVSHDEFVQAQTAAAERRFARLDADGDGYLRGDELRRGAGPGGPGGDGPGRHGRDMAAIDTDGDGAWSFSELQALRPGITIERFNSLDSNGDGLIAADERPQPRFRDPDRGGRL
jgi:hypothetical protein